MPLAPHLRTLPRPCDLPIRTAPQRVAHITRFGNEDALRGTSATAHRGSHALAALTVPISNASVIRHLLRELHGLGIWLETNDVSRFTSTVQVFFHEFLHPRHFLRFVPNCYTV
eukprot:TRINITY_DN35469_c0_g1_i1.p1 TRINITY_DN35469_c0_g1~~TRINITY_DN35469_c0_g1_i1.p1  ORF type:complete len:114 (+),score=11.53 TRINITY_DN35469_c0_g1_i1:65-406(+)